VSEDFVDHYEKRVSEGATGSLIATGLMNQIPALFALLN
jgi:hypothetical protein